MSSWIVRTASLIDSGAAADAHSLSVCQVFDQELEALQIETVQKETIRESSLIPLAVDCR